MARAAPPKRSRKARRALVIWTGWKKRFTTSTGSPSGSLRRGWWRPPSGVVHAWSCGSCRSCAGTMSPACDSWSMSAAPSSWTAAAEPAPFPLGTGVSLARDRARAHVLPVTGLRRRGIQGKGAPMESRPGQRSRPAPPPPGSPWDDPIGAAPLAFVDLEMTGLDPGSRPRPRDLRGARPRRRRGGRARFAGPSRGRQRSATRTSTASIRRRWPWRPPSGCSRRESWSCSTAPWSSRTRPPGTWPSSRRSWRARDSRGGSCTTSTRSRSRGAPSRSRATGSAPSASRSASRTPEAHRADADVAALRGRLRPRARGAGAAPPRAICGTCASASGRRGRIWWQPPSRRWSTRRR